MDLYSPRNSKTMKRIIFDFLRSKGWIEKAFQEANCTKSTVVSLLPARTDTKWFHENIYNKCGVEIEFIKGRLKFGDAKNSAPFPSMVVVFKTLS